MKNNQRPQSGKLTNTQYSSFRQGSSGSHNVVTYPTYQQSTYLAAVMPRNPSNLMNNTMTSNHTSARSTIYGSGERKPSAGRVKTSAMISSGRSNSREKSYSRLNLKTREDPQLKARLDNLMKSASTYKTKACGTTRQTSAGKSRIVIEQQRQKSNGRKLNQTLSSPRSPINLTINSDYHRRNTNIGSRRFSQQNNAVSLTSSGNYRSPGSNSS